MKKVIILMILGILMISSLAWGDITENFDGLSKSSYGTYTHNGFEINNGLCSSTNARSGNAVRLRNAASYLEYEAGDGNGKDGGVGNISFWYRSWDSSPAAVYDVKININGAGWNTIGSQINTTSTTYAQWTHDLNNTSDNILIQITWVSGERLHVDDFSITDYSGSVDPEPTNHVTNFTVTKDGYNKIDISWTENDGTQAPAGYLIKASTSDNITNPTDSTAVSDNSTIGDDSGAKNISHGTTSYEWTGLDAETQYYFKIYPYTNSGSDIDYKTDGTIPSGNATTGVEPASPTAGDLYITEVCGDGVDTGTDNGFMEIYNNSDHAISLRNVEARYYNTNPNNPSQTVTLSGEIDSDAFVIVTQNKANFDTTYTPVTADFIGSSFYFNGGDDGCDIYYVTTTTILDKFNDNGVSATPWTWNDNYTYERNSINSGADSLNWTEITSGIATPGATNSTPLSDDVSIKENYTKIADKYTLGRTYPNPFNSTFTIPLKLNENAFVNIQLINILGQKVLQIENSQMAVGNNDLQVNCENLNSGVYFVKVTIDNVNEIQKIVLLK